MTDLFGWFSAVTSGIRSVPQLLRVSRSGRSDGISPFSMAFTGLNGLAWVVWSYDAGLAPVLLSSALTAGGFLWIAWKVRMAATRRSRRSLLLVAAGYVAIGLVAGPGGLGVAGSVGSTVQFLPQAVRAFRSEDLSGISPGTYVLAAINESGWLLYAVLTGQILLGVPYLVRLPTSSFVLLMVLRSRLALRRA